MFFKVSHVMIGLFYMLLHKYMKGEKKMIKTTNEAGAII